MTDIRRLAEQQLVAYNAADLDAFVDCYHQEVEVFDEDTLTLTGLETFRERYAALFARGGFGAEVTERVVLGAHCVDVETWWRRGPESAEVSRGQVMVTYSLREGRIGVVRFLRV